MKNSIYLFALLFFVSLYFTGCSKDDEDPDGKTEVTIEYEVTTSEAGKMADIEYTSATGTQVDLNDEELPWSISFKAMVETGDALDMTVESGSSGTMVAEISIDGTVVESESDETFIFLAHLISL